ncbi:cytidine deaminase [Primorskyibacter sp. S187A]|uniref:cytidine deaminase n=1 Tax=Primorskyibacter sp. S187A TaxID=3415130 RepID=UPI003C7A28E4
MREQALQIREKAYAPYSDFPVGAVVQTPSGETFAGCNVENVAYPEGTCAEAGAIAAMVAAGAREIVAVYVVAGSDSPVPPCGGCRQKLAEFAKGPVRVTMATVSGVETEVLLSELLPGAFGAEHMS